jgi:hypothetical protein
MLAEVHMSERPLGFPAKTLKWVRGHPILAGILLFPVVGYFSLDAWLNYHMSVTGREWKRLSVDYCVGEGQQVQMKTWTTSEPQLLNKLRNSLTIYRQTGLTLIGTMRTNRLTIDFNYGNRLEMYVIQEEECKLSPYQGEKCQLSFHDPDRRYLSFHLDTSGEFVRLMRKEIEAGGEGKIHFCYDHEVVISR